MQLGIAIHAIFMFSIGLVFGLFLPFRYRFILIVVGFCKFAVWWAKVTCGIKYKVHGLENIPKEGGYVIMSKHQCAWETLFLQTLFIPQTQVLKRELLWIPFFGWGAALLNPIFINRKQRKAAMQKVLKEGKKRLDDGVSVLIFPEGTRVELGKRKSFGRGGSILAVSAEHDIIPVAHNAGEFWLNKSWIKKSGTIDVVIGEPISVKGRRAEEVNRQVEQWVNQEVDKISQTKYQEKANSEVESKPAPIQAAE